MSLIKKIATQFFVSRGNTKIRRGALKGRLLPYSIAASNVGMVFGRYEPVIQKLLIEEVVGCNVAYDIGSHVGFFTLLLSNAIGQRGTVVAFEPSESEASRIEELIRCNGLEGCVVVERMAVCDEVAELCFYTGHESFTGILGKFSKPVNREGRVPVVVQGITLDEYVYGRRNLAPDLLKIDVESAEASVIRGAEELLTKKRPKMLIEVHGPNASRDTIVQVLAHNYRIEHVGPEGRVMVTRPDQLRDLFCKGKWTNHLLALPR